MTSPMLKGQLAVIGYLRTQPAPVDKDRFLKEVRLRHGIGPEGAPPVGGGWSRDANGIRSTRAMVIAMVSRELGMKRNARMGIPPMWTTVQKRRNPIFGKRERR